MIRVRARVRVRVRVKVRVRVHLLHQLLEGLRDHAATLEVAHHRERLARPRRAVGEAAGVVALDHAGHELLRRPRIHLRLQRLRPERVVEAVVLGLGLVEPQVVEPAHLVVRITHEHVLVVKNLGGGVRVPVALHLGQRPHTHRHRDVLGAFLLLPDDLGGLGGHTVRLQRRIHLRH